MKKISNKFNNSYKNNKPRLFNNRKSIKKVFNFELTLEGNRLRNKIKFVSKMMKMNKVLREESETVIKLKGVVNLNKIFFNSVLIIKYQSGF